MTLTLDDKLVDEVARLSRAPSRSAAVRAALEAYVRQKKKEQLLALRGRVPIEDEWQALRAMEKEEISTGGA